MPGASVAERRARLALSIDGVTSLEATGELLGRDVTTEELDFVLFQEVEGLSELAFEFIGGARLVVCGSTCSLTLTHAL